MTAPRSSDPSEAAGLQGPAVFSWCLAGLCLVAAVLGCDDGGDAGTRAGGVDDLRSARAQVRMLALDLPVDPSRAEFSGLDWWGDRLVLLPQYPDVFGDDGSGALLTIDRERLARAIDGGDTTAIVPDRLPFDDHDIAARFTGWDGYEAIAFDGDRVYLSVECRGDAGWEGIVLAGRVVGSPPRIVLDDELRIHLPGASERPNFSEEALFVHEGLVWSLHELNGRLVNRAPVVTRLGSDLVPRAPWPLAPLEYRVTDATQVDADGRFFVFNQFWPGEAEQVLADVDALASADRPAGRPVERIVAMRVIDGRVEIDRDVGVLSLVPRADDVARNWEGLARWGDAGFLVVTDRHPRTLLGYVERP